MLAKLENMIFYFLRNQFCPKASANTKHFVSSRCFSKQTGKNKERLGIKQNANLQYRSSLTGAFVQDKPELKNPYSCDSILQSFLKRYIPDKFFSEIDHDLRRFGNDIVSNVDKMGWQCELNPPTLTSYDAWGNRVDLVNTCKEWKGMKSIAAKEGLIGIGYARQYAEYSRIYQMAKLLIFGPSSGLYSCPLAMVDGAAKVLETVMKDPEYDSNFLKEPFKRLTTKDPTTFWTSGQWMTEKGGGSDVGNGTDTLAIQEPNGLYKLYGYKWFTSATDADMTLALARVVSSSGEMDSGSRGLSLFYLETRDVRYGNPVSGLNGIQIQRLKDKLGTRQLPTGELLLDGAVAQMVGKESTGIRTISGMLTLTRIHNSLMSVGFTRHLLQLSKDYARRRTVFGSLLCEQPLHMQTLARLETETRGAFLLTFEVVRLLGLVETSSPDDVEEERNLLRLLTPVCKLYTAKQAVAAASEGLESFGGAGYLEDTGLPVHLRDAQVLSIWEGTTNVLSIDTLRAVAKSRGEVLNSYFKSINDRLSAISSQGRKEFRSCTAKVHIASGDLRAFISQTSSMNSEAMFLSARDFSYSLARIYIAMLLLEHAAWQGANPADLHAASMWCSQDLCPAVTGLKAGVYSEKWMNLDKDLVYESFPEE